jgi:hypothetical protein
MSALPIATSAFAITKSDTALLPGATTGGIHVGIGGTVTVTMASGGNPVEFTAATGTVLPISAIQVWSTGTSASDLVGLIGTA